MLRANDNPKLEITDGILVTIEQIRGWLDYALNAEKNGGLRDSKFSTLTIAPGVRLILTNSANALVYANQVAGALPPPSPLEPPAGNA